MSSQVSGQGFVHVRVKRETGESPVRTRHRNEGADAGKSLGNREDGGCVDF
jgi:hypothetical protein